MASLAHMPGRVRLVDEEPWRSEGVRMKAVKNFLMYFWIDEEKKLVQVFAVIYARRDQVSALSSMEMYKPEIRKFPTVYCEITQKLIQFPAIVLQYSYRFAMGAFGCKNWFLGAKKARWVQHRAFVLPSIIQYSQFAIMSIPLWRVAASIAPTACAITCPSALMKKEVGKE